jgi:hypothetical protein
VKVRLAALEGLTLAKHPDSLQEIKPETFQDLNGRIEAELKIEVEPKPKTEPESKMEPSS